MSDIVITKELSKSYTKGSNEVQALKNINLVVKTGDYVSVRGPSGSGKSTLLHMLGCLDKPTSGQVLIDSIDVTKMNGNNLSKIRRDKIGFIFQSYNLLHVLSAIENVELPMECQGMPKSKRRERAEQLIKWVGLSARKHHKPDELSGGEQQRVSIARALANQPAIILADEPTGNLDSETGTRIVELLGRLNEEEGTTIIVVTHDDKIAAYAKRKIMLRDGKITEDTTNSSPTKQKENYE
jgi:putative ABC transport system ATP-binding protein